MLDRFRHLLDYSQDQGDSQTGEIDDSEGQQASAKHRPSATGRSISLRETTDNESTTTAGARSISRQSSLTERLNLSHDSATLRSISSMLLASKRFFTTTETEEDNQETGDMSAGKAQIQSNGNVAASVSETSDSATSEADVETSTPSMFKKLHMMMLKAPGSLASSFRGQSVDDENVTSGDEAVTGDKNTHVNGQMTGANGNGYSSVAANHRLKDEESIPSHLPSPPPPPPVDEYSQITLASTSVTEDYLQFMSQLNERESNPEQVDNCSMSSSSRVRTRQRHRTISVEELRELIYWVDERYTGTSSLDKVCNGVDVIQEQTVMRVNVQTSPAESKQDVAIQLLEDLIGKNTISKAEVIQFLPGKYRIDKNSAQENVNELEENVIAAKISNELEAENKSTRNRELNDDQDEDCTHSITPCIAETIEIIYIMDGHFIDSEPVSRVDDEDGDNVPVDIQLYDEVMNKWPGKLIDERPQIRSIKDNDTTSDSSSDDSGIESKSNVVESVDITYFMPGLYCENTECLDLSGEQNRSDDNLEMAEQITSEASLDVKVLPDYDLKRATRTESLPAEDMLLYDEIVYSWPGKTITTVQLESAELERSINVIQDDLEHSKPKPDISGAAVMTTRDPQIDNINIYSYVEVVYCWPGKIFCGNFQIEPVEDDESEIVRGKEPVLASESSVAETVEIIYYMPGLCGIGEDANEPKEQELENVDSHMIIPLNNKHTEAANSTAEKVFAERSKTEVNELRVTETSEDFLPGLYFNETVLPCDSEDIKAEQQSLIGESRVLIPLATLHTEEYDFLPGRYFSETVDLHIEGEKSSEYDAQSLNGESRVLIPLATLHTEEFNFLPGLYFAETVIENRQRDKHVDPETQSLNGESRVLIPLAALHTEEFNFLPGLYFAETVIENRQRDKHVDPETQSLNGESRVLIPLATLHTEEFNFLPGLYFAETVIENRQRDKHVDPETQSLNGESRVLIPLAALHTEEFNFLPGLYFAETVIENRQRDKHVDPETQSLNGESRVLIPLATLHTEEFNFLPGLYFAETVIENRQRDKHVNPETQSLNGESRVLIPLATLHTEEFNFLPGLYFAETVIENRQRDKHVDPETQSLNGESRVLIPLATLHTEEFNFLPGLYFAETVIENRQRDKHVDPETQSLNGESRVLIPLAALHTEEFYLLSGLYFKETVILHVDNDKCNDVDTQSLNGESCLVVPSITEYIQQFDFWPGLYFAETTIPRADEDNKSVDIDQQSLNGESCVLMPLATLHTEVFDFLPGLYFEETVILRLNDSNVDTQSLNGESRVLVPLATMHTVEYNFLPGLYYTDTAISHNDEDIDSDTQSLNGGGVTLVLVTECVEIYDMLPGHYFNAVSLPENEFSGDKLTDNTVSDVLQERQDEILSKSSFDDEVIEQKVVNNVSCELLPKAIESVEDLYFLPGRYFVASLLLAQEVDVVGKKSLSGEGCIFSPDVKENVEEFYFLPERCYMQTRVSLPENEDTETKFVSGEGCVAVPEIQEHIETIYYMTGCYFNEPLTMPPANVEVTEKSISGDGCMLVPENTENVEEFNFLSGCYFVETSMPRLDSEDEDIEKKSVSGDNCGLQPEVSEVVETLYLLPERCFNETSLVLPSDDVEKKHVSSEGCTMPSEINELAEDHYFMPGRYFAETSVPQPDDAVIERDSINGEGCMLLPEITEIVETIYFLPGRLFIESSPATESSEEKFVSGEGCVLLPEIVVNVEELYILPERYFSEAQLLPLDGDVVERKVISGDGCELLPTVVETVETFYNLPELYFVELDTEAIERKPVSGDGCVLLPEIIEDVEIYHFLPDRFVVEDSSSSSEEEVCNENEISENVTAVYHSSQEHYVEEASELSLNDKVIDKISLGDTFHVTIPLITESVETQYFLPGRYFNFTLDSNDDSVDKVSVSGDGCELIPDVKERSEVTYCLPELCFVDITALQSDNEDTVTASKDGAVCFAAPVITENIEVCDILAEKSFGEHRHSYADEMFLLATAAENVEEIHTAPVSYHAAEISLVADNNKIVDNEGCELLPCPTEKIEEFYCLQERYFIDASPIDREDSVSSKSSNDEVRSLPKSNEVTECVETLYFLSGRYFAEELILRDEVVEKKAAKVESRAVLSENAENVESYYFMQGHYFIETTISPPNDRKQTAVSGEGCTLLPELTERVDMYYFLQGRYFTETSIHVNDQRQTSISGEGCVLIPEDIERSETHYCLYGKYFVETADEVAEDETLSNVSDFVIVPAASESTQVLPERYFEEEISVRENKLSEQDFISAKITRLSARESTVSFYLLTGQYFRENSTTNSNECWIDNESDSDVSIKDNRLVVPSVADNTAVAHRLIERYGVADVTSSSSSSESDSEGNKKLARSTSNQSAKEWDIVIDGRSSVSSIIRERVVVYYFMSGRYFIDARTSVETTKSVDQKVVIEDSSAGNLKHLNSDRGMSASTFSTEYVEVIYIMPGCYRVDVLLPANNLKLREEIIGDKSCEQLAPISRTEETLQSLPAKQCDEDASSVYNKDANNYLTTEHISVTSKTDFYLMEKYLIELPLEIDVDRKVSECEASTASLSTREGTSTTLDDSDSLFGSAFSFLRAYNTGSAMSASSLRQQPTPVEEVDQLEIKHHSISTEETATTYYLPARTTQVNDLSRRRRSRSSSSDSDSESESRDVPTDDDVVKSVAAGEIVHISHERYIGPRTQTNRFSIVDDVNPTNDSKPKEEKQFLAKSFNSDVFEDYNYSEEIQTILEGKVFASRKARRSTDSISSSSSRGLFMHVDSQGSLHQHDSSELQFKSVSSEHVEYATAADKVFRQVYVPDDDGDAEVVRKNKKQKKNMSRSHGLEINHAAAALDHLNDYDGDLLLYLLADQKGMRWKIIQQLHKTQAPRQVTYVMDIGAGGDENRMSGLDLDAKDDDVYVVDEQFGAVTDYVFSSRNNDSAGPALAVNDSRTTTHMQRDGSTSSAATTVSHHSNGRPKLESKTSISGGVHHGSGDSEREDTLASSPRRASEVQRRPSPRHPKMAAVRSSQNTTSASSVDSLASSSSLGGGAIATSIIGDIEMSVSYDYGAGSLLIHVCRCRNLLPPDSKRKRLDLYVKTYLLPDKSKSGKRRTKTVKNTADPMFDEVLRYEVSRSVLDSRVLWISVWHKEQFGRNEFFGEVNMSLVDTNVDGGDVPYWYKLQPKPYLDEENTLAASMLAYKGDIHLSIKFSCSEGLPTSVSRGDLHVLVHAARNLTPPRITSSLNPYCKGYLLPDRSKVALQKTPVVKRDCNPKWQHELVFRDVSIAQLQNERCLELTVWNQGSASDCLGGVRIGLGKDQNKETAEWQDSLGEEARLWRAMLNRANTWIEGVLLLRPNIDRPK